MEGKNVSILMPPPFNTRHNGYMKAYQTTGETCRWSSENAGTGLLATARVAGSIFPSTTLPLPRAPPHPSLAHPTPAQASPTSWTRASRWWPSTRTVTSSR
jgi:hypothetical protein